MTTYLHNLKTIRMARGLSPAQLADVTVIAPERIRELENRTMLVEPWLDEALMISRALCTKGIAPLIGSGNLTELDLGPDYPSDRDLWLSGTRLPLTDACRVARLFGLSDPADLDVSPLVRQLWAVIERNERGAAPGSCPVCLGVGGSHRDTCLGHNLLGHRNIDPAELGHIPRPRSKQGARTSSIKARGMKHLRTARLGKTQSQMAHIINVSPNYYSRIERCEIPFPLSRAEALARELRIDVNDIYAAPPKR